MPKGLSSIRGAEIQAQDERLTYLYGISDFWRTMFEEEDVIEAYLSATTLQLSEVYNKFLQMTSTLSLEDIQVTSDSQLKLLTLKTTDALPLGINEFRLSEPMLQAKYISNRPFLPTLLLESGIGFSLSEDGTTIKFDRPLSESRFPSRRLATGEVQYAMWVSDAQLDEKWIYNHYGKLVTSTSSTSSAQYKSLVQGLYYLYSNGPHVDTLKKGLNLVMGVPLSRDAETVLQVSKLPSAEEWIVVTNSNAYKIPYGLKPDLRPGTKLAANDELVSWITVDDYRSKDKWWINLSMPRSIVENPPSGVQIIKPGSDLDFLMSNYLKNHTFLVQINTTGVRNQYLFQNIREVTEKAKPSYTHAVYVWAVPLEDEIIDINDDLLRTEAIIDVCDNILAPDITTFRRDTLEHCRCCPEFIRSNIPSYTFDWLTKFTWETAFPQGSDDLLNSVRTKVKLGDNLADTIDSNLPSGHRGATWDAENAYPELSGGIGRVTGFIAPQYTYSEDEVAKSYMHTLINRYNINGHLTRGMINYMHREMYFKSSEDRLTNGYGAGTTVKYSLTDDLEVLDTDLLYLYSARKNELREKLVNAGATLGEWNRVMYFEDSDVKTPLWREVLVRGDAAYVTKDPGELEVFSSVIEDNRYYKLKKWFKDPTPLSPYLPAESYKVRYFDTQDLPDNTTGKIVLIHIINDVYGVYLYVPNPDGEGTVPYAYAFPPIPVVGPDELKISMTGTEMNRGLANMDMPMTFGRFSFNPEYLDVQSRSAYGSSVPNAMTRSGNVNYDDLIGTTYGDVPVNPYKVFSAAKRM